MWIELMRRVELKVEDCILTDLECAWILLCCGTLFAAVSVFCAFFLKPYRLCVFPKSKSLAFSILRLRSFNILLSAKYFNLLSLKVKKMQKQWIKFSSFIHLPFIQISVLTTLLLSLFLIELSCIRSTATCSAAWNKLTINSFRNTKSRKYFIPNRFPLFIRLHFPSQTLNNGTNSTARKNKN